MGARVYTNIVTVNGVSFYAGNGNPNASLSAARGSFYSDKLTGTAYMNTDGATTWQALGSGGGGVRSTFVWRGAGPSDPSSGVYDTFAGAHAAAAAVEGFKTIVYDNAGVTYNIVAGAYDMSDIQILGDNSGDPTSNKIIIDDGAVFTNWSNGAPFCWLEFNTTTTRAITVSLGQISFMRSGEFSRWTTSNTAGLGISPILIEDGALLSFIVDNLTTMEGDIDPPNYKEIFEVTGPGGSLGLNVFNRCNLSSNMFRGSGALAIVISGGKYEGTLPPSNVNFSGVSDVPSGSFYYVPSNLANWSGIDPQDVGAALDRIAAAVGPVA
jgi:hypothetical protein